MRKYGEQKKVRGKSKKKLIKNVALRLVIMAMCIGRVILKCFKRDIRAGLVQTCKAHHLHGTAN